MMFVPSVFDDHDYDLFDDVFDANDNWLNRVWNGTSNLMRTNVEEKDGKYIMTTELPGFDKNDIKMTLKDGVLSINAEHNSNKDEKDQKGNVIRQERYAGSISRSFYVGKSCKESDIHASYKNGVLKVEVPDNKAVEHKEDTTKYIDIQ